MRRPEVGVTDEIVELDQYQTLWPILDLVPPATRDAALFAGRVVGAATVWRGWSDGASPQSALRCHHVGRGCAGRLRVGFSRGPALARWRCNRCGDAGGFAKWLWSPWAFMARHPVPAPLPGGALAPRRDWVHFLLTEEQYDLVLPLSGPYAKANDAILSACHAPRGVLVVACFDISDAFQCALFDAFEEEPPGAARGTALWDVIELVQQALAAKAREQGRTPPLCGRRTQ